MVIHHIITKDTHDEDVMKALEYKDMRQSSLIEAVRARIGASVMEPFLKWLEENRQQVADHIGPAAGEITRREGIEGFWLMTDKRTLREILGNTDLSLEDQESLRKGLEKIENCP